MLFVIGRKSYLLLLYLLLLCNSGFSQDELYSYSQFADHLTPVNAAYSMLNKYAQVSLLGHKQFIGIEDSPTNLMIAGSIPLNEIKASAGMYALNAKTPLVRQLEVNAFFAKSIQLTVDQHLSVSVNTGMRNYSSNFSTLDPSDPEFRTDVRDTRPNIGFGIMYFSNKFYVGLSMPQVTFGRPKTAFAERTDLLKSSYYIAGAYILNLSQDVKFKPALLINYIKDAPITGNFSSTLFIKEVFGVGISYNPDDFIAGFLSASFNNLKVSYSYAIGMSRSGNSGVLNNARNEVGLTYRLGKRFIPSFL